MNISIKNLNDFFPFVRVGLGILLSKTYEVVDQDCDSFIIELSDADLKFANESFDSSHLSVPKRLTISKANCEVLT